MDFIDYREKLGIGFDDSDKKEFFYTVLFNVLDTLVNDDIGTLSFNEYFAFCRTTGTRINTDIHTFTD